jgi:flagellar biosynthesis protein FlhB
MITAVWGISGEYAITASSLMQLAYYLGAGLAIALVPLFLMSLVIGFLSTILQIGWLFTTQPLIPDFSKLDPIKGMGRLVSKRSLVELSSPCSK